MRIKRHRANIGSNVEVHIIIMSKHRLTRSMRTAGRGQGGGGRGSITRKNLITASTKNNQPEKK